MHANLKNLEKVNFSLLSKFSSNCWIAGGAISDFFLGKDCKSIDVFFPNTAEKKKAVEKLNSLGAKMQGTPVDIIGGATTFQYKENIVNLIHLGATPEECISRFDYTVCCAAIDKKGNFYYHEKYFEHLGNKEIHYIGNHPNLNFKSKSKRLRRYLEKGFMIDEENLSYWLERLIKDQNRLRNKKSVAVTKFQTKINKL